MDNSRYFEKQKWFFTELSENSGFVSVCGIG